jgi:hypothetical protein
MRVIGRLITTSIAIVVLATGLSAFAAEIVQPPEGYKGVLQPRSVLFEVDLGANSAAATMSFELANPTAQVVREAASFRPDKVGKGRPLEPLSVQPKATARLVQRFEYAVTGATLKSVRIDPQFELGGQALRSRIPAIRVKVKLPAGVERTVYSSLPGAEFSADPADGRTVMTFERSDQYQTPIVLKWQTATNVQLSKKATVKDGAVSVRIAVTNHGREPVSDIVVSDDFHPGFVSKGAPEKEFQLVRGKENDVRLIWKRHIATLGPGESANLSYVLTLRQRAPTGLYFGRTTVTRAASGELLASSDRVKIGAQ